MGIDLPTDEVRRHARVVDEVARMLDEARAAGAHVRASSDAYGFLVGPLFSHFYLNPRGDEAIDAYRKAVDGAQALAEKLRAMADDFDHSDARAAERMRGTR